MIKKFAGHCALLPDGPAKNTMVTVDDDGRIAAIEQFDPSQLDAMAGVEFHSGILVPALVNAHCHLELSYLRGAIPRGCGFAGFAEGMAAVRNRFSDEERLQAARDADREMYSAGIGAVGDIANDASAFVVKEASPVFYRTFCEVFGLRHNNLSRAAAMAGRQSSSLTPHSMYSLNNELLATVCREGGNPLSIHFMESPSERELFEGRGPLRAWFDSEGFECDFLECGSPAERLTACIPPDRSVVLVHCTCVAQRDIDIIMNHFRAPVHWCLCPRSNDFISGLQPDVGLLRRNGLNICLGTDSPASNESLTMEEELKSFVDVPLDEVLMWATRNGAEALGLSDGRGVLRVGSRCGLAVVEGVDLAAMRTTDRLRVHRLA